jgi:hypothetical protein
VDLLSRFGARGKPQSGTNSVGSELAQIWQGLEESLREKHIRLRNHHNQHNQPKRKFYQIKSNKTKRNKTDQTKPN